MALFKQQLFFETPDDNGWSETYWQTATDLATALTQLDTLAIDRLKLLRSEIDLIFAKSHQTTGASRQVGALDLSTALVGTYTPVIAAPVDHDSQEAILYRITDVAGHYNMRFLHGIGSWVSNGGTYTPEGAFVTALLAWFTFLKANCLVAKNFVHGVPTNTFAITTCAVERLTTHKVGRPFGAARGRRSITV
jgi:hypothetical protein